MSWEQTESGRIFSGRVTKYLPGDINPFLVNPIEATYRGEKVGVSHAFTVGNDIHVGITLPNKKYTTAHVSLVTIQDQARYQDMLDFLHVRGAA